VRYGVHRRTVKQAFASPMLSVKQSPTSRPAPTLGRFRAVIDERFLADRDAPAKQRHTATRACRRRANEHGADVADVTGP
jgi:hypothetical protein